MSPNMETEMCDDRRNATWISSLLSLSMCNTSVAFKLCPSVQVNVQYKTDENLFPHRQTDLVDSCKDHCSFLKTFGDGSSTAFPLRALTNCTEKVKMAAVGLAAAVTSDVELDMRGAEILHQFAVRHRRGVCKTRNRTGLMYFAWLYWPNRPFSSLLSKLSLPLLNCEKINYPYAAFLMACFQQTSGISALRSDTVDTERRYIHSSMSDAVMQKCSRTSPAVCVCQGNSDWSYSDICRSRLAAHSTAKSEVDNPHVLNPKSHLVSPNSKALEQTHHYNCLDFNCSQLKIFDQTVLSLSKTDSRTEETDAELHNIEMLQEQLSSCSCTLSSVISCTPPCVEKFTAVLNVDSSKEDTGREIDNEGQDECDGGAYTKDLKRCNSGDVDGCQVEVVVQDDVEVTEWSSDEVSDNDDDGDDDSDDWSSVEGDESPSPALSSHFFRASTDDFSDTSDSDTDCSQDDDEDADDSDYDDDEEDWQNNRSHSTISCLEDLDPFQISGLYIPSPSSPPALPSASDCEMESESTQRMNVINERWQSVYGDFSDQSNWNQTAASIRKVSFASIPENIPTLNAIVWAEDYQSARRGPWEEQARDRVRFEQRIRQTEEQIGWVLMSAHRNKMFSQLVALSKNS